MKKVRVSAREVVRDIRNRESAKALKDKYGLEDRHLIKLMKVLVKNQWMSPQELEYLALPETRNEKGARIKDFIASFRNKPDDYFLMEKYSLSAKDLQRIYEAVIENGLLSEYEYHTREKKAPEVEQGSEFETDTSTEVTLIRMDLNTNRFSQVRLRDRPSTPRNPEKPRGLNRPEQTPSATPAGSVMRASGDDEKSCFPGLCPNCHGATDPSSPDSCLYCGIVFSKVLKGEKSKGMSIWDLDYRDR